MNRRGFLFCLVSGMLLVVTGCAMEKVEPAGSKRPSVEHGKCDARLHEMCGHLLVFNMTNKRMPKTLGELKKSPLGEIPPMVCPDSGKPYVYKPKGLKIKGQSGLLVLFDSESSHSKMRWGIMIYPQPDGKPISTKVLLLRDEDVVTAMQSGNK